MGLTQYLAMTAAEMATSPTLPTHIAWMACHFSSGGLGLSNLPQILPEHALIIVTDRTPCSGHSPDVVSGQLQELTARLACAGVLLDFQRPESPETAAMVQIISRNLSCPVAVSEVYADHSDGPVFLSPAAPHQPLEAHLAPWQGRELWLEAALCQEDILVTESGTVYRPVFPPERLSGGFYSEKLHCRYHTQIGDDSIRFTLFDTPESLERKLQPAVSMGVTQTVGLWQELGTFPSGRESS